MPKILRALISVTDKNGVGEFAMELQKFGVEILSTGGTAKTIAGLGVKIKEVSEFTGFPEMLDGRVKTLHPKVHGGILGIRSNPEHLKAMNKHGIEPIDMVVVNLYAFEKTIADPQCDLANAIENIDIGGPTLLRAAAKNYPFVTVVTDPNDYQTVISEMKKTGGSVSEATNFRLAKKVFRLTNQYDGAIAGYLESISSL
ncbi:MAG: IMP cyclohydrolase [Desulfomonile sp.]|jgi:phosphoribosylaminoimidazolecarboxamide formyltransferase/IMP cyclohydrolase